MRVVCLRTVLLSILLVTGESVSARAPYEIPNPYPTSFDEIKPVTGTKPVSQDGEIYDYLKATQCGSWSRDEKILGIWKIDDPAGKIAYIYDESDGAISSGGPFRNCGNGTLDAGEQCESSTTPPSNCSTPGTYCNACRCLPGTTVCGNGFPDAGETCGEPGMPACGPGMLCTNCTCVANPICGDGTPDAGEECGEPGLNCNPGEQCTNCTCSGGGPPPSSCGDGIDDGEPCGEPPFSPGCPGGQYCNNCTCLPNCGNGTPDAGETCGDPGTPGCGPGMLCTNCTCSAAPPVCGDGNADPGEICGEPGKDCPSPPVQACINCTSCVTYCGNGTIEDGEVCGEPGAGICNATLGETCQWCKCVSQSTTNADSYYGIPGRIGDWDAKIDSGIAVRQEFTYPYAAEGLSFAVEFDNRLCRDQVYRKYANVPARMCRAENISTSPTCRMSSGEWTCPQWPPYLNQPWLQYPLWVNSLCWHSVPSFCWTPTAWGPWFYPTTCWDRYWTCSTSCSSDYSSCNACVGNSATPYFEYAGQKFTCTADGKESDPNSEWNTRVFRKPYGWVWDTVEQTNPSYIGADPIYNSPAASARTGTLWDAPQAPGITDPLPGAECDNPWNPLDDCYRCSNLNGYCPWIRGYPDYKPAIYAKGACSWVGQGLGTCSFCANGASVENCNDFGQSVTSPGSFTFYINGDPSQVAANGTGIILGSFSVPLWGGGSEPLVKEPTEYPNSIPCGREDERKVPGRPQCEVYLPNPCAAAGGPPGDCRTEIGAKTAGKECRCGGIEPPGSGRSDGEGKPVAPGCRSTVRTKPGFSTEPDKNLNYESFFRKYNVKYERDPLLDDIGATNRGDPEVPMKESRVGCYGWYWEFDTKARPTGGSEAPAIPGNPGSDYRCRADIFGKDRDETIKAEMLRTQLGIDEWGQNSLKEVGGDIEDPDPKDSENQREDGEFDEDTDLWYPLLGGGFSLIAEKEFDEKYQKDLSMALLNPDIGSFTGSIQLTKGEPLARSGFIRAFDDTGPDGPRTVARWWQKQQTKANVLFSPPKVRLLLPATWSVGIDPSDPLFSIQKEELKEGRDLRLEPIEVQLPAREDLIGEVAGYFERSLLMDVQEEPVTVLVPLGSPVEFRSLAESWCTWYMATYKKKDCDSTPEVPQVFDLIEKLKKYAERIEDVRLLRAALANYVGEVLKVQKDLIIPIADWMNANLGLYKKFLEDRKKPFEPGGSSPSLKDTWKDIEERYWQFHDTINFPWCKNDRYTTPIFSLLDPWFPDDPSVKGRNFLDSTSVPNSAEGIFAGECPEDRAQMWPRCLPVLHIDDSEFWDAVFDFSKLRLGTGTLKLPTLKPVQVRFDANIPLPPNTDIPDLPDIIADGPDVSGIFDAIDAATAALPTVSKDGAPPNMISPFTLDDSRIDSLTIDMIDIWQMIQKLRTTYQRFWDSLTEDMAICCPRWDTAECVHVEMDLKERFTRIGARPAIQLTEERTGAGNSGASSTPPTNTVKDDYDSMNDKIPNPITDPSFTLWKKLNLKADDCPIDDLTCRLLYKEKTYPPDGWQVVTPSKQKKFLEKLRNDVRALDLPDPFGGLDPNKFVPYNPRKFPFSAPFLPPEDSLYPFDVPKTMETKPHKNLLPP